nr:MAG TPA: hypothetical protein [Caudoviricetes sp.]DAM01521.1 MAG TPA: hypothetical protein [Caudoviricetes sp.]
MEVAHKGRRTYITLNNYYRIPCVGSAKLIRL